MAGFKSERKDNVPFEKHFGEYVVVTSDNGEVFLGKYVSASREGYLILNPHISMRFNKIFGERILIEGDYPLKISSIKAVCPTTKQSLESYCGVMNIVAERTGLEEIRKLKEEREKSEQ